MRFLRRLFCAHLRWRRAMWYDRGADVMLSVAAATGMVARTCRDCGKVKLFRFGDVPVDYTA